MDDLISRKALLDDLCEDRGEGTFEFTESQAEAADKIVRYVTGRIEAQPSAPAAPVVHGKWIPDTAFGNDIMSNGMAVLCSECGQGLFRGKTNYCPNCGAKMDGGDVDDHG